MPTIAIEISDNEIRHVADVALPDPPDPVRTPTYKMVVGIPIMEAVDYGGTRTYVRGESLQVELMPDQEDGTDIILGMDLLQHFHITMHGSQCIISN